MENMTGEFLQMVVGLLTAGVLWLLKTGIGYMRAKAQEQLSEQWFRWTDRLVIAEVESTGQFLVKEAEKLFLAGEMNKEQFYSLKRKAAENVLRRVKEKLFEQAPVKMTTEITPLIPGMIEHHVEYQKKEVASRKALEAQTPLLNGLRTE